MTWLTLLKNLFLFNRSQQNKYEYLLWQWSILWLLNDKKKKLWMKIALKNDAFTTIQKFGASKIF